MAATLDLSFLRERAAQKRIVLLTVAFGVLGLAYGILAPKWFQSALTVLPARQQKPGLSSLLGAELGGLATGLDSSLSGSADASRIAAVLQSVAVTDAVIEKLDLRSRYRERYQENTREAVWRHCGVKTLLKPNLVQLTCEDRDAKFAQQMLATFAEHGNQAFRRVGVSSATEEVRFLERRIEELRAQADQAATRMREFQERHQIVDLDTQSKAVVSALAVLNAQRITKQLELDFSRSFSSGDEATTRQLASQLNIIDDSLRDLERSTALGDASPARRSRGNARLPGVFPAALDVPRLRAEFEALYRDRKVAEATLVFALERFEAAKANEARDVSTFLILDPPTLPTRASRPRKSVVLALCTALGLAVSFSLEFARSGGASHLIARLTSHPPSS